MRCHTCSEPIIGTPTYLRWQRATDEIEVPSCEACLAKFERISGKSREAFGAFVKREQAIIEKEVMLDLIAELNGAVTPLHQRLKANAEPTNAE